MWFQRHKNSILGCSMALMATALWAGNFIAAKVIANELTSLEINFWRWTLASVLMLPLSIWYIREDWQALKKNFLFLLYFSFTGIFISNFLLYMAPKTASAVDMVILMTTSPIIMIFLSRIFLKESVSLTKIIGSCIAFLGVLTLITHGNFATLKNFSFTVGHFWTLGASFMFALYSVNIRMFKFKMHLRVFLQALFIGGAFWSLIAMLFSYGTIPKHETTKLFLPLFYMAFACSVCAFLFWNGAIRKIGAVQAGMIYYLVPVFG